MPDEPKSDVVNDLMGCAISLGAFYLTTDTNTKLHLLQMVNKDYGALVHKMESGNISPQDLEIALPAANEKIPTEIERRTDFELGEDGPEKLASQAPAKIGQIVNFLKQGRTADIRIAVSFKDPQEGSD